MTRVDLGPAFNPFCDPSLNAPGPLLERARAESPVFFSPVLSSFVVTRYDDVVTVLRDPETFSSRDILDPGPFLAPEAAQLLVDNDVPAEGTLIGLDPPAHTRLRKMLAKAFTPSRVAGMEDRIRALANGLVDGFAVDGETELLQRFAFPLPLTVVIRLIGIPDDDLDDCLHWCKDWAELARIAAQGGHPDEQIRLAQSVVAWHRYVRDLIAIRTEGPRDDLVSALLAVRLEEPGELTERELLSLIPGLVFAGHETTANLIGNALRHLLSAPRLWTKIVRKPELAERAVEETLRFDAPIFGMPRVVTRETILGGLPIPAGARLYLSYFSANHDEAHYSCPARFDPDRTVETPHLAFGRGIHFCIGAPLARLEGRIALEVLGQRLPDLELLDETHRYQPHFFLRGLEQVRVRWDPTAACLSAGFKP